MNVLIAVLAMLIFNTFPAISVYAVMGPPEPEYDHTLTITTYYPSPNAVYATMRFSPNDDFVPDDNCPREGEISFYSGTHELYVCQGIPTKWKKVGAEDARAQSGLGVKNDGSDLLSPSSCDGVSAVADTGDIMCSTPFYRDITFPTPFNKIPVVIVAAQHISGDSNSCAGHDTDRVSAYAEEASITKTGFRLRVGGSAQGYECVNGGTDYEHYYTRSTASWLAIGE